MRNFLIVGQTGVGKSSFVNATFGKQVASIDEFRACTNIVKYHAYETPFGDVCLIDTPGLSESTEELDLEYLAMIGSSVEYQNLYATLYISPLNATRLRSSEKSTLKLLTEVLGSTIWLNAWLVFTFAASVTPERLEVAWQERHRQIAHYLQEITASGACFENFHQIILIDNVVCNWSKEAVPVASLLAT
ncbi:MAG: GTPase [Caldilineaceae bacterium]